MSETTNISYRLYHSDAGDSDVQSISLPDNITGSDFVKMMIRQGLSKIGKIQIRCGQNKTIVYVDDHVRTATEVQEFLKNKYGSVCGFSPRFGKSEPTVITGHIIRRRFGMIPGHNVRLDKNTVVYKEAKEYTWNEPYALVKSLNPETDIVVNRNMEQIFPVATGQPPVSLLKFFNENKGITH